MAVTMERSLKRMASSSSMATPSLSSSGEWWRCLVASSCFCSDISNVANWFIMKELWVQHKYNFIEAARSSVVTDLNLFFILRWGSSCWSYWSLISWVNSCHLEWGCLLPRALSYSCPLIAPAVVLVHWAMGPPLCKSQYQQKWKVTEETFLFYTSSSMSTEHDITSMKLSKEAIHHQWDSTGCTVVTRLPSRDHLSLLLLT